MNVAAQLESLWSKSGLLDAATGTTRPALEGCPNGPACWGTLKPAEPGHDHAPLPWVGPAYSQPENRLLVIGINLHEHGGRDALADLVDGAKRALREGRRQAFGSVIWHRMPLYASIMLNPEGARDEPESLAAMLDKIAYTNHVKCSPPAIQWGAGKKDRSAPTPTMWSTCGTHVLKEEVECLDPEKILLIGTGENWWRFLAVCAPDWKGLLGKGVHAGWSGGRLVACVWHPNYRRGGMNLGLSERLRSAIQAQRAG